MESIASSSRKKMSPVGSSPLSTKSGGNSVPTFWKQLVKLQRSVSSESIDNNSNNNNNNSNNINNTSNASRLQVRPTLSGKSHSFSSVSPSSAAAAATAEGTRENQITSVNAPFKYQNVPHQKVYQNGTLEHEQSQQSVASSTHSRSNNFTVNNVTGTNNTTGKSLTTSTTTSTPQNLSSDNYYRNYRDKFLSDRHNFTGRVFGVSLTESLSAASAEVIVQSELVSFGRIPIVVAKCGAFLKANALETAGIFRISGNAKRIKELQIVFSTPPDYGTKFNNWDAYTVHDVASLLRRYLNNLNEPLIPLQLYELFRDPLRKRPRVLKYMSSRGDPAARRGVHAVVQQSKLPQTANLDLEKENVNVVGSTLNKSNTAVQQQNNVNEDKLFGRSGEATNNSSFSVGKLSDPRIIDSKKYSAATTESQKLTERDSDNDKDNDNDNTNKFNCDNNDKNNNNNDSNINNNNDNNEDNDNYDTNNVNNTSNVDSKEKRAGLPNQSERDALLEEKRRRKYRHKKRLTRDIAEAIKDYESLFVQLSNDTKQLTIYLLDFLSLFARQSQYNLMTSRNLAAIFQPCILSHPQHDMDPLEYKLSRFVVEFLIGYAYKLLPHLLKLTKEEQRQNILRIRNKTPSPKSRAPENGVKTSTMSEPVLNSVTSDSPSKSVSMSSVSKPITIPHAESPHTPHSPKFLHFHSPRTLSPIPGHLSNSSSPFLRSPTKPPHIPVPFLSSHDKSRSPQDNSLEKSLPKQRPKLSTSLQSQFLMPRIGNRPHSRSIDSAAIPPDFIQGNRRRVQSVQKANKPGLLNDIDDEGDEAAFSFDEENEKTRLARVNPTPPIDSTFRFLQMPPNHALTRPAFDSSTSSFGGRSDLYVSGDERNRSTEDEIDYLSSGQGTNVSTQDVIRDREKREGRGKKRREPWFQRLTSRSASVNRT